MELLDCRRLPGPNLVWDKPCALLEVQGSQTEIDNLLPVWESTARQLMDGVGWQDERIDSLQLNGGAWLVFSTPLDVLYAATDLGELIWKICQQRMELIEIPDIQAYIQSSLAEVKINISQQSNAALLRLQSRAISECVTFLWDDDEASLGLGKGSQTWRVDELPEADDLDWNSFTDIPVAMVTGTNGKTTTTRLAQHILMNTGLTVGLSSTDWISINNEVIDRGDWSGPGGARQVLRVGEIDAAILETARGGLLRRGMALERATAAVITNISEDHLGDFGSKTLRELLNIKWLTSRTVESAGVLILNADDALLVEKSRTFSGEIVWFSLDESNTVIKEHVANGGMAYVYSGGDLLFLQGDLRERICQAQEIPITLGGAGKHNIANALSAAALTAQFGVPIAGIREGLKSMSQDSNPGRSNVFQINGFTVIVDFAHNPAAIQAIFDMAAELPARRRLLSFGQAGDRPDDLIRDCVRSAFKLELDTVIVSELADYHRGRSHGEIHALIKNELISTGMSPDHILHFEEEMDSLRAALDWAKPGDLVIMLALGGSKPVLELLASERKRYTSVSD